MLPRNSKDAKEIMVLEVRPNNRNSVSSLGGGGGRVGTPYNELHDYAVRFSPEGVPYLHVGWRYKTGRDFTS